MISVLVTLIILGLLLWLVDVLPIDARIKQIIKVVAIVFIVIWLLQLLGVWTFPMRLR